LILHRQSAYANGYLAFQSWLVEKKKSLNLQQRGISAFLVVFILTSLTALSATGAAQMAEDWKMGPLPIQPVTEGIGSVSLMTDIEDPGTLLCYLELEPYLDIKKQEIE
jgi:hypothetical protein